MAYVGYAGQGDPSTGQQGLTRSQMDPGLVGGLPAGQNYQYSTGTGGFDITNPYANQQFQQQQLQGLLGLYGPELALSGSLGQQQIDALTAGGLYGQAQLQQQMNAAQQGAMYQLGGLGLQGQSLDIQKAALARQLGELPQQYNLQQQGFGLQEQQIGLGEQSAWRGAQQQQRGIASQLTASGNPYSVGGGWQRQDVANQLQSQLQGFGLNRQQIGLERQGAALNYAEKTASLQDAQKELGIQSQQLGLNESEVRSRLDNALAQMGLQGKIDATTLLAETSKIKQGMVSPLSGLIGLIGQATNMPLLAGGG